MGLAHPDVGHRVIPVHGRSSPHCGKGSENERIRRSNWTPDIRCMPRMLRIGLISCFLRLLSAAHAQADTVVVDCDTLAYGIRYTSCSKVNGEVIAFGATDKKGRKTGWWCELRDKDSRRMEGKYRKGIRVGTWWVNNREFFVYNRWGKIVAKGSGCRRCPLF